MLFRYSSSCQVKSNQLSSRSSKTSKQELYLQFLGWQICGNQSATEANFGEINQRIISEFAARQDSANRQHNEVISRVEEVHSMIIAQADTSRKRDEAQSNRPLALQDSFGPCDEQHPEAVQGNAAANNAVAAAPTEGKPANTAVLPHEASPPRPAAPKLPRSLFRSFLEPVMFFSFRVKGRPCPESCSCKCHCQPDPRFSFKPPEYVRAFIGAFFRGYMGYPKELLDGEPSTGQPSTGEASTGEPFSGESPSCDIDTCLQNPLRLTYALPLKFLSYKINAVAEASAAGNLTFMLTTTPRIEHTFGYIIYNSWKGNMPYLRRILQRDPWVARDARPLDARLALQVVLTFLDPRMIILEQLLQRGAGIEYEDEARTTRRVKTFLRVLQFYCPGVLNEVDKLNPYSSFFLEQLGFSFIHRVVMGIYPTNLPLALREATPSDVNERNRFGRTPLMYAVCRGDAKATRLLIDNGAATEECDYYGATALLLACDTQLGPQCLDVLLEAGANVDHVDFSGWTGLHIAAQRDLFDTGRKLVEAGATLDVQTRAGITPLMMALESEKMAMFPYLLEAGADANVADQEGQTVLSKSIVSDDQENMRMLLENGVRSVGSADNPSTLLHAIAKLGDPKMMKMLGEFDLSDIDPQARNRGGFTAVQLFRKRELVSDKLRTSFANLLRKMGLSTSVDDLEYASDDDEYQDASEYLDDNDDEDCDDIENERANIDFSW